MSVSFDLDFAPEYGAAFTVAPGVRRITANNPGPYTFRGTNTYLVGEGDVTVIDPGPDDAAHVAAILGATVGERIGKILLTHSHRDHVGALDALASATGGEIVRPADGDVVAGPGFELATIATPGHASDHLSFALSGTPILFTGDHVMGWSTSVVAPPDGSMAAYMRSLERLLARPERRYLPGHGGPIENGPEHTRGLRTHRKMREAAILARLAAGDRTIPEIVAALYQGLDPRLTGAAGMSVLAHLEDLVARGVVVAEGPVSVEGRFRPGR